MQTRQDITAARLLEMNPDMLVGSAARANALASGGEEEGGQQLEAAPTRIERPVAPAKAPQLSMSRLPREWIGRTTSREGEWQYAEFLVGPGDFVKKQKKKKKIE